MNRLLLLLLLLVSAPTFAQDYLDNNANNRLSLNFENGIPEAQKEAFQNFKSQYHFENIQGLDKSEYTVTNAQISNISIQMENIGRVVIYAKIFNDKDSTLFSSNSQRRGMITLKLYRDDKILKDKVLSTNFDDDIYQQIHFNSYRSGIDKVQIDFETKEDVFIIEKLEVIPYNRAGITYYTELENSEKEILDLANNLSNEASKIKTNYTEQLKRIQYSYTTLSSLIGGHIFESVAITKANSLNPFKDDEFNNHYNALLNKASQEDKSKIEKLSNELKDSNFNNVALTLDNLFLDGKFSSLINLVDGLFKTNFKIKAEDNDLMTIIYLDEKYYAKQQLSNNKLKLLPIEDKSTLNKIQQLTEENNAFKTYISQIGKFLKTDMETLTELNKDILDAKDIRSEFEKLTWDIIDDFTKQDKSEFIKELGINFVGVTSELESQFVPASITDISKLKKLRSESIISIKKLNELLTEHDKITSKIKKHYDIIYQIRPNERKTVFDNVSKLPPQLIIEWKNKQDAIIAEYTKPGGLKNFIARATGKE